MTDPEQLKRRIHERMIEFGRDGALARLRGGPSASPEPDGATADDPDVAEASLREATGRSWEQWREVIDAWPGHTDGHAAVARHLVEEHGVPGWWAQTITVGWERISGRRRTHQRADGTFEVTAARTVAIDADLIRSLLRSDAGRAAMFPGYETELRSRPGTKDVRFALGPGMALASLDPKGNGRTQVSVAFSKLPDGRDLDRWKAYWKAWLSALAESA